MRRVKKQPQGFVRDLGIVALSVLVAIVLVRTGAVAHLLIQTQELEFVGSFIAGMFFTSIFTTAPATVTLAEISQHYSLFLTAVVGGAGAVAGDMLIFSFVKDRFSQHVVELVQTRGIGRRLLKVFRRRSVRWLTFVIGGLIIASPLPDELGVSLLGFTKMKLRGFLIISFVFNSIGILLIGIAARAWYPGM